MSEFRDAALEYAARGWAVIPLKPRSKEPLTAHAVKDASRDPGQIERWWAKWPQANIGLATGSVSGVIVIDADDRNGGDESLVELERKHGPLPETPSVKTPGGAHYYLAHPGGEVRSSAGALGRGLDVKARGGYVVAPPSIHPSGRPYIWDEPPDEVPLALPGAPLETQMREAHARRNGDGDARLPEAISEGERNDRLFKFGCRLRGQGMEADELEDALVAANRRCRPPLDDAEVRKIAASAASFEMGAAPPEPARFHPLTGEPLDPVTGEPVSKLDLLNALSGDVEFRRVLQMGEQDAVWFLWVWSRRTNRPVKLKSFTTAQLFEAPLSKLAARIREVRGGKLPTPRRGSDAWEAFTEALETAAEFEAHGSTEEGSWRRRLAVYLGTELTKRDPTMPEGKRAAIESIAEPFEDPEGRVWIHPGAWLEALAVRRVDANDAAVKSALRQMGFEPQPQLTAKFGPRNHSRRYWRSRRDFEWGAEE